MTVSNDHEAYLRKLTDEPDVQEALIAHGNYDQALVLQLLFQRPAACIEFARALKLAYAEGDPAPMNDLADLLAQALGKLHQLEEETGQKVFGQV
jgi:hypothetical protein